MSDSSRPHGLYSLWNSPGQNTVVGSLSLLQGMFPTQGSSPSLPYCSQLSHQGNPKDRVATFNKNFEEMEQVIVRKIKYKNI